MSRMASNQDIITVIQTLETEMRGSINQVMTNIVQEVNEKLNKILESMIQNAELLEKTLSQQSMTTIKIQI